MATTEAFINGGGADSSFVNLSVKYNTNTSKPHMFIACFSSANANKTQIIKKFESLNKNKGYDLQLEVFDLSPASFAVCVKTFDAMYPSKKYSEEFNSSFGLTSAERKDLVTFWISDFNYKLFYGDRNISTYLTFFNKNY